MIIADMTNSTDIMDPDDPRNPEHVKKDVKDRLGELIQTYGCPLEELFRIATDLDEEPSVRLNALKEVTAYTYPKRKALEVSGPEGGPIKSELDLTKLSDKELETLIKITSKAAIT